MNKMSTTNTMPSKIMVENNLSLHWLTSNDADDLFRIIQDDPEIGRNVTWPATVNSLKDARRAVEEVLERYKSSYVLQKDGITIGFVGTWGVNNNDHEIRFSYFLAKDERGHGYVTLTVRKLMQVVKQNRPIVDTFVVNITDANKPSQAVAAKLGFRRTDVLKKDRIMPELMRRYERPVYD